MKARRKKSSVQIMPIVYKFLNNPYLWTLASFALTLYSALAIGSFNPHDPSWFYASTQYPTITNYAGAVGAHGAALAFYTLGNAAYTIPFLFVYTTYATWKQKTLAQEWDRMIALLTLPCIGAALAQSYHILVHPSSGSAGGILGSLLYQQLAHSIGMWSTYFLLLSITCGQLLIITRLSLFTVASWILTAFILFSTLCKHILAPCIRYTKIAGTYLLNATAHLFKKPEQHTVMSELDFEHPLPQQEAILTAEPAHQPTLEKNERPISPVRSTHAAYHLPPLTLYAKQDKQSSLSVTEEHKHLVTLLQEKLARFGIIGTVTAIKPGPVVTLFEYQPEIDTKLSKITALENDLALALEALSVRIIAPIPGTSRVGFEVANKERKSVLMGDAVRSQQFTRSTYHLPIVLGSDTVGESVIIDLTDTPHLLVAGSTGSGKSVALNTLLLSIVTKRTPDEVKLVIIDPKRLEFAAYQDISHLLFPIITQPSKASPVLKWLVRTMEERYEQMAQAGVRTVSDYHKQCHTQQKLNDLPYIVVIIDELADLMMVAGKEIEESIARLAQMARAAGIHLVVATQRPSVDVITGVIKVNFPSRISFRVTSKIDSRTILDTTGAEHLLGKGDMLFMDAQSARIRRVHGAYVTDKEIQAVVHHIKTQRAPIYVDLQDAINFHQQATQEQDEPLLKDILTFLDVIDEVSISLLQRRFKIGYNRSARIIELLEQQGKIMPADGSKTRKIIR